MEITIFVFNIRKPALIVWSLIKTWKYSDLHVFALIVGTKTSSPERFVDFVLVYFPFWGHLNIDLNVFFLF